MASLYGLFFQTSSTSATGSNAPQDEILDNGILHDVVIVPNYDHLVEKESEKENCIEDEEKKVHNNTPNELHEDIPIQYYLINVDKTPSYITKGTRENVQIIFRQLADQIIEKEKNEHPLSFKIENGRSITIFHHFSWIDVPTHKLTLTELPFYDKIV